MITSALELARTAAGLVIASRPHEEPVVRRGMRIAGARYIVQAALTLAVPELRVLGAAADGLHAASMLALAGFSRRYRRPALAQAVVAAAFAAAEFQALSAADSGCPARKRRRS